MKKVVNDSNQSREGEEEENIEWDDMFDLKMKCEGTITQKNFIIEKNIT